MEALFNILIAVAVLLGLGIIGGIVFGASDCAKERKVKVIKTEEEVPEVQ